MRPQHFTEGSQSTWGHSETMYGVLKVGDNIVQWLSLCFKGSHFCSRRGELIHYYATTTAFCNICNTRKVIFCLNFLIKSVPTFQQMAVFAGHTCGIFLDHSRKTSLLLQDVVYGWPPLSANSLRVSSPATHCWDELRLHRYWSDNCCSLNIRQRTGVLGSRHQHHSEERHQLLSGVTSCGWYSGRLPRHPLRHNHQPGHTAGLLWMPFSGLFCPGTDSKLHLQSASHCNW